MDFAYSERCERLRQKLLAFMEAHVYPNERRYKDEVDRNGRELNNRWIPTEVVEELKPIARAEGLWNLFLPNPHAHRKDYRISTTRPYARSWVG